MRLRSLLTRLLPASMALAMLLSAVAPAVPPGEQDGVKVESSETTHSVDGSYTFGLPEGTTHITIRWPGHQDAAVQAAFSTDGSTFSDPVDVFLDEFGEMRGDGISYGAVMIADGDRQVRVTSDEPLADVTVMAMNAGAETAAPLVGAHAAGVSTIPQVISRAGWGADETVRFDANGEERWGRAYYPLQKLVIHHTAGANSDPNPAATVRAIYRYHAVTQDWGDIGYQYLIDNAGRVYEGRYSREYWYSTNPTADDGSGLVVEGGHAYRSNPGTMGIALMGTYNTTAPPAVQQASLVRLLAWAARSHGINPLGQSTYVNPVTGFSLVTANIAGHRDYDSTGCPGAAVVALLPSIRARVAAEMAQVPGETYNPTRNLSFAAGTYTGRQVQCGRGDHRLEAVHPELRLGRANRPEGHHPRPGRQLVLHHGRGLGWLLDPGIRGHVPRAVCTCASGRGTAPPLEGPHVARRGLHRVLVQFARDGNRLQDLHPGCAVHGDHDHAQRDPQPGRDLAVRHERHLGWLLAFRNRGHDPGRPATPTSATPAAASATPASDLQPAEDPVLHRGQLHRDGVQRERRGHGLAPVHPGQQFVGADRSDRRLPEPGRQLVPHHSRGLGRLLDPGHAARHPR